MKKDNLLYLHDIRDAIDWILNDYVFKLSFDEFTGDHKTQDAVIRQIAIIGEALNSIDDEFLKKHQNLPSKEAVAMRNVLVHDYDSVDLDELWKTINTDLPNLKSIIEDILKTC